MRDDLIQAGVHACPIAGVDGVEDILDAFLGVLVDRADEWTDQAVPLVNADQPTIAGFIAVLRGDT